MVTEEQFLALVEKCLREGKHELLRQACAVTLAESMTERFGDLPIYTRKRIVTATTEQLHEWLVRHLTAATVTEALG